MKIFFIFLGSLFLVSFSLQVNAQTNSGAWSNSYTDRNGNTWSDVLAEPYASCVTKNPPTIGIGRQCEPLQMIGEEIADSDAIRACHAINGEVPTSKDIELLINDSEEGNLPNDEAYHGFILSSTYQKNPDTDSFEHPISGMVIAKDNCVTVWNDGGSTVTYECQPYVSTAEFVDPADTAPVRCIRYGTKK